MLFIGKLFVSLSSIENFRLCVHCISSFAFVFLLNAIHVVADFF